mmetsp:Transcript_15848/g.64770  ORF Transcript_15848/g.64770 Transcript_15848/m.64770 type:complete len:105 (+) Transcript_15848:2626-2940(+)
MCPGRSLSRRPRIPLKLDILLHCSLLGQFLEFHLKIHDLCSLCFLLLLKKGHLIISSLHLTRDEVNPLANVAFCFQDILVQPNRFQLDVDDPLVSDFTCSCLPV